jgi:2-polyprenyl-6-hydroxyphenyl methylase/3-demethylubiquinone-9 3-methyltransferase
MSSASANVSPAEVARFDAAASRWWDAEGELRTLHHINPARLDYLDARVGIAGKRIVDVGCGGGLLSEGMAQRGARVLGIDMAQSALQVAELHALETGTESVEYRCITVEALAAEAAGQFDVVTCLEMIEHVPDPASVVHSCARLVKPGGAVFFSTLNRNPKSYALAIVAAEYLLKLVPKGTHHYGQFIRPSELAGWARDAGLELVDLSGLAYNPATHSAKLTRDLSINYLAHFVRPAEERL